VPFSSRPEELRDRQPMLIRNLPSAGVHSIGGGAMDVWTSPGISGRSPARRCGSAVSVVQQSARIGMESAASNPLVSLRPASCSSPRRRAPDRLQILADLTEPFRMPRTHDHRR